MHWARTPLLLLVPSERDDTVYALDGTGAAAALVDVGEHGVELDGGVLGGAVALGQRGQEALDDGLDVHADDRVERADHAHVGHIRGATRQHLSVGGWHMGV